LSNGFETSGHARPAFQWVHTTLSSISNRELRYDGNDYNNEQLLQNDFDNSGLTTCKPAQFSLKPKSVRKESGG
jgi:hypothetical protein